MSDIVKSLGELRRFCGEKGITFAETEDTVLRTTFLGTLEHLHSKESEFQSELRTFEFVDMLTVHVGTEVLSVDMFEFSEDMIHIRVGSGHAFEGFRDVEYFELRSEDDFKEFEKVYIEYVEHVKKIVL